MSEVVISVEDVAKRYRLGLVGSGTLREDVTGWWYKVRGKEDPYAKIGETNDRTTHSKSDYVWALKDINFEVKQGEVLGIIGKNGAGKSTLLKLLSRVTAPTTGNIKVKGRIASLLEVGTGFHPELTGRENIYLNGAIMGMKRGEITRKLDEIIDFAGVERYVDTPVKRYSSGMYVRLAFAVAAHLEPEILIIDEVLAVGDAEFQKKALGKMKDVSSGEGRTVLFVSHNMTSVSTLCTNCLVMENGTVAYEGTTDDAIEFYLKGASHQHPILDLSKTKVEAGRTGPQSFYQIQRIELLNHFGNPKTELLFGQPLSVKITFECKTDSVNTELGIAFSNGLGLTFGGHVSSWNGFKMDFEKGMHVVQVTIPFLYLFPGQYHFSVWIKEDGQYVDDQLGNAIEFTVVESHLNGNRAHLSRYKHLNITFPTTWKELSHHEKY